MNNSKRAEVYARQRGGKVHKSRNEDLTKKTVAELRAIADDREIKTTSKMRKGEIITLIESRQQISVDLATLTPKQRRRMRKKANRQAA